MRRTAPGDDCGLSSNIGNLMRLALLDQKNISFIQLIVFAAVTVIYCYVTSAAEEDLMSLRMTRISSPGLTWKKRGTSEGNFFSDDILAPHFRGIHGELCVSRVYYFHKYVPP